MNVIEIVEVHISQLNELQEICIQSFREAYEPVEDPVQFQVYIDAAYNLKILKSELENQNSDHFFIKQEGEIAGYLKTNISDAQTEEMGEAFLEVQRIYLLRAHYGQGMGRLLIYKAIEIAQLKNKPKIWLGVWEENLDAVAFYKRLGFKTTGTHAFFIGNKEEVDLVMELKV